MSLIERIDKLRDERRRYYDADGDGVDVVLLEAKSQLEAMQAEIESKDKLLKETLEYITPLFSRSAELRDRIRASLDSQEQ